MSDTISPIIVDTAGRQAADVAMRAAVEYLKVQRTPHLSRADQDTLIAALKRHVIAALPAALDDAREAMDVFPDESGTRVATATFLAAMQLAGIAAAKEVVG